LIESRSRRGRTGFPAPTRATLAAPTSKVAVTPNKELRVGELRKQAILGSEAVYRVRDWNQTLVRVEVVRAPGLEPGQTFQFAVAAVAEMAVVLGPGDSKAVQADGT
jgi:hypothetical protein